MKRIVRAAAAVLLVAVQATAWANNCYSVYNNKGVLIFQSVYPPVEMDGPITEAVQKRFPGATMVFVPIPLGYSCPKIDARKKDFVSEEADARTW